MAVKQFLLTYDDVEHNDIHQFLNSIPSRQKSKYVRMAIQEYLRKINYTGEVKTETYIPIKNFINNNLENNSAVPEEDTDLIEIDSSILDLGT